MLNFRNCGSLKTKTFVGWETDRDLSFGCNRNVAKQHKGAAAFIVACNTNTQMMPLAHKHTLSSNDPRIQRWDAPIHTVCITLLGRMHREIEEIFHKNEYEPPTQCSLYHQQHYRTCAFIQTEEEQNMSQIRLLVCRLIWHLI